MNALLMIAIPFFAGCNGDGQFILFGRCWARSIRCKSTGRIRCFVKIQIRISISVGAGRIQESATAIGFVFVGLIGENKMQVLNGAGSV